MSCDGPHVPQVDTVFFLYKWLKTSVHVHSTSPTIHTSGVHVRDEPEHADQPASGQCQALLRSGHQVPAQGFHLRMIAIDDGCL